MLFDKLLLSLPSGAASLGPGAACLPRARRLPRGGGGGGGGQGHGRCGAQAGSCCPAVLRGAQCLPFLVLFGNGSLQCDPASLSSSSFTCPLRGPPIQTWDKTPYSWVTKPAPHPPALTPDPDSLSFQGPGLSSRGSPQDPFSKAAPPFSELPARPAQAHSGQCPSPPCMWVLPGWGAVSY